jgi:hypothetical protein
LAGRTRGRSTLPPPTTAAFCFDARVELPQSGPYALPIPSSALLVICFIFRLPVVILSTANIRQQASRARHLVVYLRHFDSAHNPRRRHVEHDFTHNAQGANPSDYIMVSSGCDDDEATTPRLPLWTLGFIGCRVRPVQGSPTTSSQFSLPLHGIDQPEIVMEQPIRPR